MRQYLYILAMSASLAACGGGGNNNNRQVQEPEEDLPPTISAVADQSLEANSSSEPLAVTVTDDMTDAAALALSASSDNGTLLPDEGLALSGDGGERTLVITPADNETGTATVTLSVADAAGQTVTTSFLVTVEAASASFAAFVRTLFDADANDEPREINALQFNDDGSDFDDLVAP